MRVAVWGAGDVGTSLAYRLATSPHVSELHWINKTLKRIEPRVVDIEHGLAFAPSCHRVVPYGQEDASLALDRSDLLVLTHGAPVATGDRAALWPQNKAVFRESAIPALQSREHLIVLVVSNPVDCLSTLVHDEAVMPDADRCVIGLGTTVETARLRASLADTVLVPARELPIYAVGTHDGFFVPVWSSLGPLAPLVRKSVLDAARSEVCHGPKRIRDLESQIEPPCAHCGKPRPRSTRHPIVEAAVSIIEAVGSDTQRVFTVSAYDPERKVCWSVPCTVGRDGVLKRHLEWLEEIVSERAVKEMWSGVREELDRALKELEKTMGRGTAAASG